ncbi:MAG: TIGR02452 family protein, partial [Lachnospiraceae bacterium]|nr:TIGR02452 family protein [Lachnospiraceae bacterium]
MNMTETEMLNDSLDIFSKGTYTVGIKKVRLKLSREEMSMATVLLPEEVEKICSLTASNRHISLGRCGYGCVNMDSFALARMRLEKSPHLFDSGKEKKLLVLNMANPVNPGGGVRNGAKAQEEDLCRKSSLLLSLESMTAAKYYQYNRSLESCLGSDAMILSPEVEIIRDEQGRLLPETSIVSVLTCAAPMIRYGKEGLSEDAYRALVFRRITAMLKCAVHFGYRVLVLGAWGCGAFGNDAKVVSDLFYRALKDFDYMGMTENAAFRRIDFAVLDKSPEQYNFKVFSRNFAEGAFYREEDQAETDEARERIRKREVHLDSIRGCLFGGAVGDALGYPIEFRSEEEIRFVYGEHGIREYFTDDDTGKALISDDTQMTLFTANGLLFGDTRGAMRGIRARDAAYVAEAYQDWYTTQRMSFAESRRLGNGLKRNCSWLLDVPALYQRRAPGNTCLSALSAQRSGKTYGGENLTHPPNESKGCGGIMRVAPIALLNHMEIEYIDREAAEIAAITHGHSLGYMPAAVLAHIIHRIVFSERPMSLKEIILEARKTAKKLFHGDKHLKTLC